MNAAFKRMNISFGALFVASLFACSSPSVSDRYDLQTLDSEDASKRFTYGFSARGQDRDRSRAASVADMRRELENYMAATGYCEQGYFIYDETFDGAEYLLHGECQESQNHE